MSRLVGLRVSQAGGMYGIDVPDTPAGMRLAKLWLVEIIGLFNLTDFINSPTIKWENQTPSTPWESE